MNTQINEKNTLLGRKYAVLSPQSQKEARSDAENIGIPTSTFYRLLGSNEAMEIFKRFVVACSLVGLTAKDLHENLKANYDELPEKEKAQVQCLEEFLGENITTVGFVEPFTIPKGLTKKRR